MGTDSLPVKQNLKKFLTAVAAVSACLAVTGGTAGAAGAAVPLKGKAFTVEMWVKLPASAGWNDNMPFFWGPRVGAWDPTVTLQILHNSDSYGRCPAMRSLLGFNYDSFGGRPSEACAPLPPLSTSTHVVFTNGPDPSSPTSTGTVSTLWFDDNKVWSAPSVLVGIPTDNVFAIGGQWIGNSYWAGLTASYDEVAVYSRALTAEQIGDHYSKGMGSDRSAYSSSVLDLDPLLYWPFDQGQLSLDASGNGLSAFPDRSCLASEDGLAPATGGSIRMTTDCAVGTMRVDGAVTRPDAPTLTRTPSKRFTGPSVTVAIGGGAGAAFSCTLDGTALEDCGDPVTLTGLADGRHTPTVSQSLSGYDAPSDPAATSWTVDTVPPVTPLLSGVPSSLTGATTASIGISGESNATFSCSVDGNAYSTCTSPRSLTDLPRGPHSISVVQTDEAGNASGPATASWIVVPAAPSVSGAPAARTNSNSASIGFSGDSALGFECSIDGGAYAGCDSPVALTALAEGAHSLSVRQSDEDGNPGVPATVSWTVDRTPPAAPSVSGPESVTLATSATISFSGESGAPFSCSVDGGGFSACSSPLSLSGLARSSHSVAVRQTDAAGNVGAVTTFSWVVIPRPTVPTITSAPAPSSLEQSARVFFSAPSAASTICSEDGRAYSPCTSPVRLADLSAGTHSVSVKAVDAYGNQSDPATASWSMDLPVGVSINNADIYTNNPKILLSLVWSTGVTTALVANDGGFRSAVRVNVGSAVPWTLVSSGSERLPKNVYIRFDNSSITYQDDIILDQTPPVIDSVTATATTVLARRTAVAARASLPAVKLALRARDANSGVGNVQITTNKTQAGTIVPYATNVTFRRASTAVKTFYVRVQDKAKNYSAWKTITVR